MLLVSLFWDAATMQVLEPLRQILLSSPILSITGMLGLTVFTFTALLFPFPRSITYLPKKEHGSHAQRAIKGATDAS
jgi:hypothetical protein